MDQFATPKCTKLHWEFHLDFMNIQHCTILCIQRKYLGNLSNLKFGKIQFWTHCVTLEINKILIQLSKSSCRLYDRFSNSACRNNNDQSQQSVLFRHQVG